jgi:hypothetical protein
VIATRRVIARCVLLEVALRDALDHELHGQRVNEAIHAARMLDGEIRTALA